MRATSFVPLWWHPFFTFGLGGSFTAALRCYAELPLAAEAASQQQPLLLPSTGSGICKTAVQQAELLRGTIFSRPRIEPMFPALAYVPLPPSHQ